MANTEHKKMVRGYLSLNVESWSLRKDNGEYCRIYLGKYSFEKEVIVMNLRSNKTFNAFVIFFIFTLVTELILKYLNIYIPIVTSLFNSSKNISENLMVIIITVLAALIAVQYIIFQNYRNRYPLIIIREKLIREINFCLKNFFLNAIFGSLFLIVKYEFTITVIPYIAHSLYCGYFFLISIKNFSKMDSTALLDDYKSEVILKIKEKPLDSENIKSSFKEINQINEDSFLRQEIAICYYNLKICEEINIYFIVERDSLLTNGISNKQIEEIQTVIFQSIIKSIKISEMLQNDQYVEKALGSINRILKTCIDCDKYDLFERLIDQLDDFFNYNQSRNNLKPCLNIIVFFGYLFEYIIDEKKREEWIKLLIDHFKLYTLKSTIHTDEILIKAICGNYFNTLEKLLEKDHKEYYITHLDNIMFLIFQIVKGNTSGIDNFIKILIATHTKEVINKQKDSYLEEFSKRVVNFCQFSIRYNYEDIYTFLILTIDKIIEESKNELIITSLSDAKFDITVRVINSENDFSSISIPNYQEILKRGNYAEDILSETKEKYYVLLRRVLLKKNTGLLLYFIQNYTSIIIDLGQQQRTQQEALLNLFGVLLHDSISINNREGFYLILDEFTELIKNMDKESKISEGLMNYCIQLFSGLINRCVKEKQNEVVFNVIERVIDIHKTLSVVSKKTELQKNIIEALFQAGLDAVENHNEEIICNVSNHLGWVGKNAIENSNSEILTFILNRATIMFNISYDLDVNKKTIIFIGTLFIVLGGYINSVKKSFLPIIIGQMKQLRDKSILNKSKNLRLYESSKWDDLMNGNAQKNIESFTRKILEKSHNA